MPNEPVLEQVDDLTNQSQPKTLGVISSGDDSPHNLFPSAHRDIRMAVAAVIAGIILVSIERMLAYRDHRRLRHEQI